MNCLVRRADGEGHGWRVGLYRGLSSFRAEDPFRLQIAAAVRFMASPALRRLRFALARSMPIWLLPAMRRPACAIGSISRPYAAQRPWDPMARKVMAIPRRAS